MSELIADSRIALTSRNRGYDWGMNLTFNGKERDEPAWNDVLARADGRFKLEKIVSPKGSMLSIIEVSWQA